MADRAWNNASSRQRLRFPHPFNAPRRFNVLNLSANSGLNNASRSKRLRMNLRPRRHKIQIEATVTEIIDRA
jgi:hypothetical protein